MKKLFITILCIVMAFTAVACSAQQPTTAPEQEATGQVEQSPSDSQEAEAGAEETAVSEKNVALSEGWMFDSPFVTPLNPTVSPNGFSFAGYASNFYETLVTYEDGEFLPGLAESWEISPDGKTYTFKLKEGVKFSDGEDLTAEVIKLNLEALPVMLGDFNGAYGSTSINIENMEVVDDHTIAITLINPYYGTLQDLSVINPHGIMSPNAFGEDLMPSEATMTQTFGTGPYMYEGSFENNMYTFVRNPHYHGEAPEADTFTVSVIADPNTAVLALNSGEIDSLQRTMRLSYDAFSDFENNPAYTTVVSEGPEVSRYLALNTTKFPFDDKVVRNAVAMALDMETVAQSLYNGNVTVSDTIFPSNYAYCEGQPVSGNVFDVDAANALLEENGYVDSDGDGIREKDGQKLTLSMPYQQTSATEDNLMLIIADQLQAIGLEVLPQALPPLEWFGVAMANEFNMSPYQTYGFEYDPFTTVSNMRAEIMADPVARQVGASSEEINLMLNQLTSTVDPAEIERIYNEVFAYIYEEDILIPLFFQNSIAAYNNETIENIELSNSRMDVRVADIDLK